MNAAATSASRFSPALVTGASLSLLAALTLGPLLLEPRPVDFLEGPSSPTGIALVLGLMALALRTRAWLDRATEPRAGRVVARLAALAALLTLLHAALEMPLANVMQWQRQLYLGVFNGGFEAPHPYRPLPYGFTRLLERLTHHWIFACLAYRWFFTFWFLWASYRLARRYLEPERAGRALIPLVALYPLSVLFYWGQLTDPLSHALLVLAILYVLEDRPFALAAALGLGVLAKETAVIVAAAYLACYWRRGWRSWWIAVGLGGVCLTAFLAARLPHGWRLGGFDDINGTTGLMIGTNLGFGEPISLTSVPLWQNYLHPLLFVGIFVPFLAWRWNRIDPLLRVMCLTLTPLVLGSTLCFGWLYESRNYVPLLPLLTTMAVPPAAALAQRERIECQNVGA